MERLAIFHHDPYHDDAFMRGVEGQAKEAFEGSFEIGRAHV